MKTTLIKTVVIISTILAMSLTSCQRKDASKTNAADDKYLAFNVDQTLLDQVYRDDMLRMQFHPPRDWKTVSDTLIDSLYADLKGSFFKIELRKIFLSDSLRCACVLSKIDSLDIEDTQQIFKTAEIQFTANDRQADIRNAEFHTEYFRVRQTLAMTQNMVFFRLLFDHPETEIFEVDYFLPKDVYVGQVRAIESSIGSIKPLNM